MKQSEVLQRILDTYEPLPFDDTCDTVKFGEGDRECTGIVTSCALTVEVIREAIHLGANLIIVHEPCFYTHEDRIDWLADNTVFNAKTRLLREHGILVWRNHDHMHHNKPDEIFLGMVQALGWEKYLQEADFAHFGYYVIPPVTLAEAANHIARSLHVRGGRMVGNPNALVSRLAFCGHIFPSWNQEEQKNTNILARDDVDVLIALESIDWTTVGYARDASQLGLNKAIIHSGHFLSEEPGMNFLASKLSKLFDGLFSVTFVPSGDPWLCVRE